MSSQRNIVPGHRQAALVLTLGLVALESCSSSSSASTCREPPLEGEACCDTDTYARVPLTDLVVDPLAHAEGRVETRGEADWYPVPGQADCPCLDGSCACTKPLGLRSTECEALIELTGSYAGRPVECSPAGCWPLQPLSSYSACGHWRIDATTARGALVLEAFCAR